MSLSGDVSTEDYDVFSTPSDLATVGATFTVNSMTDFISNEIFLISDDNLYRLLSMVEIYLFKFIKGTFVPIFSKEALEASVFLICSSVNLASSVGSLSLIWLWNSERYC